MNTGRTRVVAVIGLGAMGERLAGDGLLMLDAPLGGGAAAARE